MHTDSKLRDYQLKITLPLKIYFIQATLFTTEASKTKQTAKIMVQGGGFEPPKLARQIYSLIPLATREPLHLTLISF